MFDRYEFANVYQNSDKNTQKEQKISCKIIILKIKTQSNEIDMCV